MSATLNAYDYEQQRRINVSILHFAGLETGVYPKGYPMNVFSTNQEVDKKIEIRNHIIENPDLITQHAKANINNLSAEDIEVAAKFRDFVYGDFYMISFLKKHTLFFGDDGFVYGVHALRDPFENFYHPRELPVRVRALLFPFKDKIIYDGMLQGYGLRFGSGMSSSIRKSCQESKAKYGVITTLPFQVNKKDPQETEEELITFYMKNAKNRSCYEYEIDDMIGRNPKLLPHYYRECGKVNARSQKKTLKNAGIKKRHFAIVDNAIIASGATLGAVEQQVNTMLDNEAKTWVHYFKI